MRGRALVAGEVFPSGALFLVPLHVRTTVGIKRYLHVRRRFLICQTVQSDGRIAARLDGAIVSIMTLRGPECT